MWFYSKEKLYLTDMIFFMKASSSVFGGLLFYAQFQVLYLEMISFFLKILFIYSWGTHRERQRQKQAPWGEPSAGLNPRTPGSLPEPKADAQPLSHPGIPKIIVNL